MPTRRHIRSSFYVLLALALLLMGGLQAATPRVKAAPVIGTVYRLTARHSGKVMEVQTPNTSDGAKVGQWTWNGNDWQKWRFESAGTGYYRIVSINSGKCLDVNGASTTDGAQIIQWACGTGTNQQWQVVDLGTGYNRLVARHSGKCVNVQGGSTADGALLEQWTCDSTWWRQQWSLAVVSGTSPTATRTPTTGTAPGGLVGFAAVSGMGRSTTTGGSGGTVVTVSSTAQFLDYIGRTGRYVIQFSGTITLSGMNRVTSDKTLLGIGSGARIVGGGLTMSGVQNIIIRNISFSGATDDSINIEQSSHHIWIDHCDFSNGYDGLVDIKRGSDFITVSWNHFHHHDKVALLSHDDGNASQDLGHLRVTYHHNWFNGTGQRHPRVRFANPVHVYNNYYLNVSSYGVASTMNAGVLVEGNYFEGVRSPMVIQTGDSDPGRIVQRSNIFVNSGSPQTSGSVVEPRTYYSYTLDSTSNVPSIVRANAGVGKI